MKLKHLKVAGMLLMVCGLAACGDDSRDAAVKVGKVVKGPVTGAKVFDKDNVDFATTDATGTFTIASRKGPFRTTGGTYLPLNANGTAGAAVAAPPMSAPEGFSQVTPLSTLINSLPLPEQAALTAKLATLGFTPATDLSVKSTANAGVLALSESIGAVLQSANANNVTGSAVTAMIVAVNGLTPPPTGVSLALTAVTSAVTNAINASTALNNVATILTNVAATAAQGSNSLPNGALPTTGTTGGTGTGTGTGI
ncbi:MAG: hypothetical protein H7X83_10400 [Verrucomicrobia bacterium]|nr:hypothetical protein [Deltaproteobacteria bacterium]